MATFYVKNSDELLGTGTRDDSKSYLEDIIADPGVGTLEDGLVFHGWSIDTDASGDGAEYTIDTEVFTVETIRQYIADNLLGTIKEGDELNVYAMIFKVFSVTYLDEAGISLGADDIYFPINETQTPYTVSHTYTAPDPTQNFEGWKPDTPSNIVSATYNGQDAEAPYKLGTEMVIKGNIVFSADAPKGAWLVFEENGGTYNAPQFVKSDDVTHVPPLTMEKRGYSFGGWYEDADFTQSFTFGQPLPERKTIYAKWNVNETAGYTVIIWAKNLKNTAYEVVASTTGTGRVGNNIPYTFRNNGDEDYVTINGTDYHYTGFCLNPADVGQAVEITPEGDAVLNLHFDRITYNLRIYLYRRQGTGNNSYYYAQNSNAGSNPWGIASWYDGTNLNNMPTTTYGTINSEVRGNSTGYYILLSAYYGEDISSKWPRYDQINGPANNRSPVSFIMMNGTGLKGNTVNDNGYGDGRDTIKGLITTMDEKILGVTNDANGNYLVVRFNTYYNWHYHIWYETVDGEDYTGITTQTWNGKTYYEADNLTVRSSNNDVGQQNPPQYSGFEYVGRRNENWTNNNAWNLGGTQQSHQNNPANWNINYVYNRLKYPVEYFDGEYVDDEGNRIQNRASHIISTSAEVEQGAIIPDDIRNYTPPLPAGQKGFVFAGWYLDDACTVPYTWGTMPVGGITVFAKWQQIQYRVFLHPNAGTDPTLDWGTESQAMNFRVDYEGKVSAPTGLRTEYEFIGWYTDADCTQPFNADTKLDGTTVTADYDKTVDMTDPMDKWGNGATSNNDVNRFWITKKLDLYALWSQKLTGALGIGVQYDANGGSGAPLDNKLYKDNVNAIAQGASVAPENKKFMYWVVQEFKNGEFVDTDTHVYPGDPFRVLKDNARDVENEDGSHTYTVQLRAEYGAAEIEKDTYIDWYLNDGVATTYIHKDDKLQINEATEIFDLMDATDITVKRGNIFLGWAREPEYEKKSDGSYDTTEPIINYPELTESDVYLKYNADDGQYYVKESETATDWTVPVTEVAADEKLPYQALYAVWGKVFYVIHGSDKKVTVVPISDRTERNMFTTGYNADTSKYTNYYYGGYGVVADATAADPTGFTLSEGGTKASFSGNYEWTRTSAQKSATAFNRDAGDIYYIKEVPSSYLASPLVATVVSNYGNGELTSLTILSVIDTNIYRSGGENTTKGTFASTFTMTQNAGDTNTFTANDLFGLDGYLIVNAWTKDSGTYELTPFWITYDNITVNSNSNREIVVNGNQVQ